MKRTPRFASRSFPSPGRSLRSFQGGAVLALLLAAFLFADVGASAQSVQRWLQPGSVPAMKPRFRTTDTTFLIGCYSQPEKLPSVDSVWRFLEAYGVLGTLVAWNATDVDAYLNSADRGNKWVMANANPVTKAAWGREIQFYLHADTSWSDYWVSKFYSRSGGEIRKNDVEEDWYHRDTYEQFYQSSNTTAGDTIAKWIAFDWRPGQTNRYKDPGDNHDTTVQTSWQWIGERRNVNADELPVASIDNDITYVVATGHIFDDASTNSDPDATVYLRIDVVHERPEGSTYKNSSGAPMLVSADYEEEIVATLEVTKADLKPLTVNDPFDRYREVVFAVDMTVCADGSTGPGSGESSSKRFDLRVQWTGEGKVALRSVAIRDDLGQLLMGRRSQDVDFRADIFDAAKRAVYGPDWETDPTLRDGIIRYVLGDEPISTEWAGFEYLNLMLRDSFNLSAAVGDSLPGYTAQTGNFWYAPHFQNATTYEEVTVQHWYPTGTTGWNYDPVEPGSIFRKHVPDSTFRDYFSVPFMDIPSIQEHNGGRFNIPELPLDPAGVAGYTETFQRLHFGAYLPGLREWERSHSYDIWRYLGQAMNKLGLAAETSRNTGRALLLVPGIANSVEIDWKIAEIVNGGADTAFERVFVHSHISEPSELRMSLNLGLCYGAVGTIYYWLTNYMHVMGHEPKYIDQHDAEYWAGLQDSYGPISENSEFHFNTDTLRFRKNPWSTGGALVKEVVPDFFTGYKNRSEELIWLNKQWLSRIGVEMMRRKLRWRDAYSVHGAQPRPNTRDTGLPARPLPSNEIVTAVKAWHPGTGKIDSAWATYVELGLFYTAKGAGNTPLLDTNYVYVVNRRTFERSPDIPDTSLRGRMMDTLAETRTIELTLNLPNPDTSNQYNRFVRVREVLPDLSPLPLIGQRQPLDTILTHDQNGKSKVRVSIGSGRACLLECTYAQPDESIVDGLLTRNNQRKMLYDPESGRYYATYHRYDSTLGDWHVFFRRSIPVATTGTILWEPMEWPVSEYMDDQDVPRTLNTHPSITYRHLPSGDPRISIVWTAHPNGTGHAATEREVLIRDITYHTTVDNGDTTEWIFAMPIRNVGFHYGVNADEWGTPVVSSAGFGEYVAWSDSTKGIVARGRLLDTSLVFAPTWTPYDTVSLIWTDTIGMPPGKYPTLPPFTHRALNDSSAGIAWQQQWPPYTGIFYGRLYYTPPSGGGPAVDIGFLTTGDLFISPHVNLGSNTQQHLHPSIDQSQDALGRVMEGVTWERHYYIQQQGNYITDVFFRSILFDTASMMPTLVGQWINKMDATFSSPDPGFGYPVVSSQNQVMAPADSNETPLFSVVYMKDYYVEPMSVLDAKWIMATTPQWRTTVSQDYSFGGAHPSGVASEGKVTNRYAALYRQTDDNVLRTSREFFSRTRPGSYQAEGVEVWGMLDDSLSLSIGARLYDVWKSDVYSSCPLGIATAVGPDSLHQMLGMLRSHSFETSDSVEIGGMVWLQLFVGDSAGSAEKEVVCRVELVDSATGDVTAVLDSVTLSADHREDFLQVDHVVDVLSGTYYVRVRFEAEGLEANKPLDNVARKSIGYVYGWIPGLAAKRARLLDGNAGSAARISAQPNPFEQGTEVRFSTPRRDHLSVTVFDAFGRKIAMLVDRELFEPGRYAMEFDGERLPAGTYIVELRTSTERVVEKVMLRR